MSVSRLEDGDLIQKRVQIQLTGDNEREWVLSKSS